MTKWEEIEAASCDIFVVLLIFLTGVLKLSPGLILARDWSLRSLCLVVGFSSKLNLCYWRGECAHVCTVYSTTQDLGSQLDWVFPPVLTPKPSLSSSSTKTIVTTKTDINFGQIDTTRTWRQRYVYPPFTGCLWTRTWDNKITPRRRRSRSSLGGKSDRDSFLKLDFWHVYTTVTWLLFVVTVFSLCGSMSKESRWHQGSIYSQ